MGLFSKTKTVDIFFVGSEGTDLDRGIYAFYFNVDNGEIIKKSFVKSLASPLAMNKNGRFMYLTYRNGTGRAQDGGSLAVCLHGSSARTCSKSRK